MRLRHTRRIQKLLRSGRFTEEVKRVARRGGSLEFDLRAIALDSNFHQTSRGDAVRLLRVARIDLLPELLAAFFTQSGKEELYTTALAIEETRDRRAINPLISALLTDSDPDRRHAAARALGWLPGTRKSAWALGQCLADAGQPQPAREEAAESLSYVGMTETVPVLIEALRDPDVRIRFWSVFGLNSGLKRQDARAIAALESVLDDRECPPGDWWSVGKEVLGLLGTTHPPVKDYAARLRAEVARIQADPDASPEDRSWAESYG